MMAARRACAVSLALLAASGVLAQGGAPAERRESRQEERGVREIVYRDGRAAEERLSSPEGYLIEELYRDPEGNVQTVSYIRSEGRLVRAEARDAAGALIGSMDYRYDGRGRLLGVSAAGSLGGDSAGVVSSGGSPSGSWSKSASGTIVVTYDSKGRPVEDRRAKEGVLTASERRTYAEGPASGPSSSVIGDKASGDYEYIEYDAAGRQTLRLEYSGGSLASRSQLAYDEKGRLTLERTARAGSLVERRLAYDEAGALSREETRRDGVLERAVSYSGELRSEELYDDGSLFVRATYRGALKIKDEFYVDGALARTKEYR